MNIVKLEIDHNLQRAVNKQKYTEEDLKTFYNNVNDVLLDIFLGQPPVWDSVKGYIKSNYKIQVEGLNNKQAVELLTSLYWNIEKDAVKRTILGSIKHILSECDGNDVKDYKPKYSLKLAYEEVL